MKEAFPEAMVEGYEDLVEAMPNDKKDRHVAAAAVKMGAEVIVTNNLKDFRQLPENLEAISADAFLCGLLDLYPEGMIELIEEQASALKRPERTLEELMIGLAKTVPKFIQAARKLID